MFCLVLGRLVNFPFNSPTPPEDPCFQFQHEQGAGRAHKSAGQDIQGVMHPT